VVREKSEKKMFKVTAAVWDAAVPVTVMLKGLGEFAESEFTFTMLVCPPLIEEGLNEQVTPPPELQLSAFKEVKELGAAAAIIKVVEVLPISRTDDVALAERENCGVPLPESVTAREPPVESLMVSEPVTLPDFVGVKVTLAVQLALTLRVTGNVPQVLVSVNPLVARIFVI